MAHIVPFKAVAARDAEAVGAEAGHPGGAQIIIFPGVRRERHAGPQAGGRQPGRDWLDLTDEQPTVGM